MRSVLLAILLTALLSGCAGKKQPFMEITDIPQNRGVVYIYMPKKGNIAKNANIAVDNSEGLGIRLGKLNKGHHMTYVAPTGDNLFRIGKSAVSLNVENGQSYFISMKSYKVLFSFKHKPFEVDPTAGFQQIKGTQPQAIMMY